MANPDVQERLEELYHTQNLDMKYKVSYTIYKLKPIWPFLNFLATYFYLILTSIILVFALYYQLAIVWGIYLIIYMVQSLLTSRRYFNHRTAER